jgi:hypothetical protein
MNPDVARAIPELVREGIIPEGSASMLLRVAQRDLVSVHYELRVLLYSGVLLLSIGIGLLVKDQYARIGPIAIALALGAGAAASLMWVASKSAPFTWQEASSPHFAFDYILLLGVLLASADLAFIEANFAPLGERWPWHLLLVSIGTAALAVRYDSRTLFSLALSTFAAWRGVSTTQIERLLWPSQDSVQMNAFACGALFVSLGIYLRRSKRKEHFEPIAAHLGWLLMFAALVFAGETGMRAHVAIALLLGCGVGLGIYSYRRRRFSFFAYGVVSAYIAVCRWIVRLSVDPIFLFLWFSLSSLAVLVGLWKAQRQMREPL